GVGDAGVVKIERELVIHLDALLDLLHVLDLDAQARLLGAMGHPHLLGLLGAELLEFGDDVFGGHLLSPSSCETTARSPSQSPNQRRNFSRKHSSRFNLGAK